MRTSIEEAALPARISSKIETLLRVEHNGERVALDYSSAPHAKNSAGMARVDSVENFLSYLKASGKGTSFSITGYRKIKKIDIDFSNLKDVFFFQGGMSSVEDVVLQGLSVGRLDVHGFNVDISHCRIGYLSISTQSLVNTVSIRNCDVGVLHLHGNGGKDCNILISGGRISELNLPSSFDPRELWLENVCFEVNPLSSKVVRQLEGKASFLPRLNRASFSILYDWAEKKGNSEIAHIARGRELAIQRPHAKGGERLFLNVWGIFGDFGNSYLRPILWMFLLIEIFFVLLLLTGTDAGFACKGDCGWRENLVGISGKAQIFRSAVGSLEGIFSPFSVFSQRALVLPESSWVAALKVVYSYICLGLLFLFGFSIRRRFKVH